MKSAKVFIVHGYMAGPSSHWFPWLKNEIEKNGGKASILSLPDSNNPKAQSWNDVLLKEIKDIDESTYLVGHSLGCITLLNFISGLPEKTSVGGLICVSGFSENLPNIPAINEFTNKKYDIAKVKKIVRKKVVVLAKDDQIVLPEFTERLAKELDAPVHSLEKGGHFLGDDGFKDFPLVLDELKKMASKLQ